MHTYIVKYQHSYANNELAILFELIDGTFAIKYDGLNDEEIKPISKEVAASLIE